MACSPGPRRFPRAPSAERLTTRRARAGDGSEGTRTCAGRTGGHEPSHRTARATSTLLLRMGCVKGGMASGVSTLWPRRVQSRQRPGKPSPRAEWPSCPPAKGSRLPRGRDKRSARGVSPSRSSPVSTLAPGAPEDAKVSRPVRRGAGRKGGDSRPRLRPPLPRFRQRLSAGVCAVHAVMLGGESPLSRCTWSRRTREAHGRHREVGSEGSVERTCGARDTNRIGGVVRSGRAGTRPQSPPSTRGCALYIRRLCTDGRTADHGRAAGCPGSGLRGE